LLNLAVIPSSARKTSFLQRTPCRPPGGQTAVEHQPVEVPPLPFSPRGWLHSPNHH